jgi:hypothetical protein
MERRGERREERRREEERRCRVEERRELGIQKVLTTRAGVGIPGRYEEFPNIIFLVLKFQERTWSSHFAPSLSLTLFSFFSLPLLSPPTTRLLL